MKIIIFGASGMVGQGVLREALLAPDVEQVLLVGRTAVPQQHAKLQQLMHTDMMNYGGLEERLSGYDACFFCLGVSAIGRSEARYARLTYDYTMAAAQPLAQHNPNMAFVYVSGAGTDSTEKGGSMWARVKGRTENALQRLPFKAVYLFRAGAIEPLNGTRSKTLPYRFIYAVSWPFMPLMRKWWPRSVLSTEIVGQAMLAAARGKRAGGVMETGDIYDLSKA
ncbi:NAD-dependent epimerase/dehydratase family protein [Janthinobacterium agaricidamnosum]|uniref:NAD-dependent epimerase/dehydratase n=1 Tax=Janthinobacterium agaricidamnosum NBRC 102515 = DSM 9628 TaxID=1349767 RepID=W0V5A2_9BURK|nr:NAD-dependent epimerase/dehydratase family protein [Janthinobacterium agaricidamnosum]CDG83999.1 NAD-dependent epimerase/dehydratase [Janthinobacterium agaricidamnosum NBRC 102515 = DSM 9628]